MAGKWKLKTEKLRKKVKRMRKIIELGMETIKQRDARIAQLSSVVETEMKLPPATSPLPQLRKANGH